MSTKQLLTKYNESFAAVMNEGNKLRYRYDHAGRALTLAEVLRDPERITNAAAVLNMLGAQCKFNDERP